MYKSNFSQNISNYMSILCVYIYTYNIAHNLYISILWAVYSKYYAKCLCAFCLQYFKYSM